MIQQQLVDESSLVQAVFAGGCDDVIGLLQEKENPNSRDASGRCALHAAAWKGDFRVVEVLLQSDASVSPKDKDWYTPLHWACACKNEAVVELLVDNKADLTARDRCWRTPLHIAAANNAVGCAELLLTQMSNVNVTDRGGHSSLHHAAYNGHHEMAEFLIERNCSVNACDKKERRPLHYASYMGHNDLVRLLYNCGADINAKDKMMWTPLHAAAASGNMLVTEILLELGADKEARTSFGNTPLHVACLNGHANVATALISWQAPIHAVNLSGQTPLHFAAASTGGGQCLELLLKQGANCNAQSEDGRTPLHMTAVHGRFARSKLLFDHGANIDSIDKMGCTALHIAALHGHELLSTTLLNYRADPSKPGFQGRTPLHMCCLGGYVECCRKIIQAGVDLNCQDSTGKTPLHLAAFKGNVECLELLVSNKANVQLTDNAGRTALHLAAARGHFECLYTLVVCGSTVNEQDADGCTPLHLASAYDMEGRCVSYLVTHKAMPLMRDRRGFTAFHYGVAGENETGLQHLLSAVSKVCLYGSDMPKTTPLHLAANCGNSSILKHLLPLFSDTNIKDENGRTALHLAAYKGHEQCVCLLIRCGARICVHDGKAQQTPVHLAALANRGKCLSMLLESSENSAVVDTMDVHKRTPLSLAVGAGNMYCVVILLEAQASVNIVDKDRHPPLFRAVVSGHKEVIELILDKGGNLLFQDNNGKTALHLAAACGHVAACITLLQACTASQRALLLSSQDYHNCTPLHWACYNGHASTVQYLLLFSEIKSLEGNAFSPVHCAVYKNSVQCLELLLNRFGSQIVGLKDKQQRTALHIAALVNSLPCAELLLRHHAALEDRDLLGRTPLVCAATRGHHLIIRALLEKKADVRACDNAKNTALHHACNRPTPHHTQCALLLLEKTFDSAIVNMPNKHRRTPLHLSARNGLVPVTRLLLERGASSQMVDCKGLTPALACARNPDVAQCLALILSCTPPPTPFYLLNNLCGSFQNFLLSEESIERQPGSFSNNNKRQLNKGEPPHSDLKKLSLNISAVGNVFQAPTSPTECNLKKEV